MLLKRPYVRAKEETVTPVTDPFTPLNNWDTPGTEYDALSTAEEGSCKVVATLQSGADGIIMEAGGFTGLGLAVKGGTLYFGCGEDGGSSDADTAMISAPAPTGSELLIEWSASSNTGKAALYVGAQLVGTDTFSRGAIADGNPGTIEQPFELVRAFPVSVDSLSGGSVSECRIFRAGQITSDVQ